MIWIGTVTRFSDSYPFFWGFHPSCLFSQVGLSEPKCYQDICEHHEHEEKLLKEIHARYLWFHDTILRGSGHLGYVDSNQGFFTPISGLYVPELGL